MIQILENEEFIQFADFSKDVWLLNRKTTKKIDDRVINIPEITESFEPSVRKLPKLMTEIHSKYGDPFPEYEILTDKKSNYEIRIYVCDVNSIKIISKEG